jgi:hypothetical protein
MLLAALLLGGCVNYVDVNDRNQRALGAAALGAGTGALLGSLSGDAAKGALIGGALGGVIGALTPAPDPNAAATQAPYPAQGWDPRYGGW